MNARLIRPAERGGSFGPRERLVVLSGGVRGGVSAPVGRSTRVRRLATHERVGMDAGSKLFGRVAAWMDRHRKIRLVALGLLTAASVALMIRLGL